MKRRPALSALARALARALAPVMAAVALIGAAQPPARAADWPRWLGPGSDNRTSDTASLDDLDRYRPLWTAAVGRGYSSVIVAAGRAYVMGHEDATGETVFCLDAATGEVLWKHAYPAELLPRMHTGGPNASATVVGPRVLTVGKDGQMFCFEAATGTVRWSVRLTDLMGVALPQWGFASSPVMDEQRILVSAGKVAALDPITGRALWISPENDPPAYATPVPFHRDGTPFIAAMTGRGLSILAADDGAPVAHRPFKAQFDLLATTPTILDDGHRLFISGNASAELLAFDGARLTPVWSGTELRTALNQSVLADGILYGIDGRQGTPTCRLVAVNLADGTLRWARDRFGYGNVIGVGNSLLALTENGELVAAAMTPDAYRELGRLQILGRTCWTTPTFANGRIYARNDQGALVCLALPRP